MTDREITDNMLREILVGAKDATAGPWSVWQETTKTKDEAKAELIAQVENTEQFAGAVYLLNANGKCPATTGCGPTSAANARHIARLDPQTVSAIVTELLSHRARRAE